MTALPPIVQATGASVTEGEFKTFLSDLRAFLAGLLGTDGNAATARSSLGVPAGSSIVASFNTRTGAVTLSLLDVTNALGYTPHVAGAAAPANGGNSDTVDGYHANNMRITSVSSRYQPGGEGPIYQDLIFADGHTLTITVG